MHLGSSEGTVRLVCCRDSLSPHDDKTDLTLWHLTNFCSFALVLLRYNFEIHRRLQVPVLENQFRYNFDNFLRIFSRIVPVLRIVSKTVFGALVPYYCFIMNSSSRTSKKERNTAHQNVVCGLPGHGVGTGPQIHETPSNTIDECCI